MTNDLCVNFRHKISLPETEVKSYEQENKKEKMFFKILEVEKYLQI